MHTWWRTKWQSALSYGWDDTEIKPLLTFWLKSGFFLLFVPAKSFRNNADVHWQYGPVVPNRQNLRSWGFCSAETGQRKEKRFQSENESPAYIITWSFSISFFLLFQLAYERNKMKACLPLHYVISGNHRYKKPFYPQSRSRSSPRLCFLPAQERCKSNWAAVWAEVNLWERWFLLGVICFQPLLIPRNSPSTQLKVDYAHSWIMKVFDWNLLTAFMANLISRETVQAVTLIQATRVDSSTLITL